LELQLARNIWKEQCFALLGDPSVMPVFIDTSGHATSAGDSTHRTHSAANQALNDVTKGRFALR